MGLSDPRQKGSGNPVATNVLRFSGKKAAIITLIGDTLKGVIPVLIAKACGFDLIVVAWIALAAFLGHLFPIYYRFHGGKGVATALGCLLALHWQIGVALLFTWLFVAMVFRYSSLSALIAAICAPIYAWIFTGTVYLSVIFLMSGLLILRHRKNIKNLISGKEDKIGAKKKT